MATNTLTQPAGFPQPKQLVRQGLVVAVLLVTGVGLGMVIDTGRAGAPVKAQAAATDVAAAEHGAFTSMTYRDPSAIQKRFVGSDAELDPAVAAAEHGAFTSMTYRDPSVIQKRFGGSDANLDPAVAAAEHGAFTSMTYRDPSVIQKRFVGSDAELDPF